jgi:hypothetical protein
MCGRSQKSWVTVSARIKCQDVYILARLVPESTSPAPILAATKNVSDQALSTVDISAGMCSRQWSFAPTDARGAVQTGSQKRPTASHPMTIAAIYELVCPTREASFRRVLSSREPRYQTRHVDISLKEVLLATRLESEFEKTYLGIITCGSPSMHRHAKAQKA